MRNPLLLVSLKIDGRTAQRLQRPTWLKETTRTVFVSINSRWIYLSIFVMVGTKKRNTALTSCNIPLNDATVWYPIMPFQFPKRHVITQWTYFVKCVCSWTHKHRTCSTNSARQYVCSYKRYPTYTSWSMEDIQAVLYFRISGTHSLTVCRFGSPLTLERWMSVNRMKKCKTGLRLVPKSGCRNYFRAIENVNVALFHFR